MIIRRSGPFGGRTALAAGLCRALPRAVAGAPEAIDDLARGTLELAGHAPRPRHYRDLPLWRQLNGDFVVGLVRHTGGSLIVPMAVLDPGYANEILIPPHRSGGFHHLIVRAAPAAPQERIAASRECGGDAAGGEAVRAHRRRRAPDHHRVATDWTHTDGCVLTIKETRHAVFTRPRLTAPHGPDYQGTRGMTCIRHAVPPRGRGSRHPFAPHPDQARGAWS